jgi:hypothetical protein
MTAEERCDGDVIISSRLGLFSSAIVVLDVVMSETLPINAVARANGVRLMIFFPFLSNSHSISLSFLRTPDVTVHSQALPLVSLEVRHLLFPFISYLPSQHHSAPLCLAIIGSRLGLSRTNAFIAGTSE